MLKRAVTHSAWFRQQRQGDRPVRDQRAVGGGLCACPAGGGALVCLVAQRENFQKGRRVVRLALCRVFGVCVCTLAREPTQVRYKKDRAFF